MIPAPLHLALILGIVPVLFSCSEEKIRTYRVAVVDPDKEAPAQPKEAEPRPLRWQAPDGWQEAAPGQFQVALYRLGENTQVAVSMLPGDGGGVSANVNRWRGQLGMEATTEVGGETIKLEGGGATATWFELRGDKDGMLAAIVLLERETWFFKLSAPSGELETRREEFMSLLKSIRVGTGAMEPDPPRPNEKEKPRIVFDVPEGWEESKGSSMRVASFRIPGTGGLDGDVSVVPLLGDGGSTLENVNRWRAQLQLPALESEDDPNLGKTLEASSGPVLITHMVSNEGLFEGNRRGAISGAILRTREVTWFFKLTGEADLVRQSREGFEAFVRSAVIP